MPLTGDFNYTCQCVPGFLGDNCQDGKYCLFYCALFVKDGTLDCRMYSMSGRYDITMIKGEYMENLYFLNKCVCQNPNGSAEWT